MKTTIPLLADKFYHIYNRGNNAELIFYRDEDYERFLRKHIKYCCPVVNTYAYCLMNNHFHFLVRIRSHPEPSDLSETVFHTDVSRQFAHLFNSHAQYINKHYDRTGSLFEKPFKRLPIDNENYFIEVLKYIHWNPQFHHSKIVFDEYPFSSYDRYLSSDSSRLERDFVFNLFGGRERFVEAHHKFSKRLSNELDFD